jgi:hypothetical protein
MKNAAMRETGGSFNEKCQAIDGSYVNTANNCVVIFYVVDEFFQL